jgi:acyl transferase domain-containing protein
MENDKQEPIAIVGMGCRFPGDADTPNGFWELLSKGESAWSKVPRNRFNIDGFHHPSSDRGGAVSSESWFSMAVYLPSWKITANSGFFLKQDAAKWDASFFSMTPAEAAGTDPQQRILLEVAYEAFENGQWKS